MRKSLDLGLDGVIIDLIQDVEETFGIGFGEWELQGCRTVGDLHALIQAKTPSWDHEAGPCGASAVFHALRRLLDPDRSRGLTPGTLLATAWRRSPRALSARIRREAGLRPPALALTWIGKIGLVFMLGALAVSIASAANRDVRVLAGSLFAAVLGFLILRLDPRRFRPECDTLGELVRRIAPLNVPWLKSTGRRAPKSWTILVSLAAEYSAVPRNAIGQDTLLLESLDGE